jgi:hypothetical protein
MTATQELHDDPRFQNLLAKAETHQRKFRPRETAQLEAENRLAAVLEERTAACWESLKAARRSGLNILEAEEEALPMILLPEEEEA